MEQWDQWNEWDRSGSNGSMTLSAMSTEGASSDPGCRFLRAFASLTFHVVTDRDANMEGDEAVHHRGRMKNPHARRDGPMQATKGMMDGLMDL